MKKLITMIAILGTTGFANAQILSTTQMGLEGALPLEGDFSFGAAFEARHERVLSLNMMRLKGVGTAR